ncbi:MAG: glycosyltransferase family 4 protein, partial [Desulfobaccales bacterium]
MIQRRTNIPLNRLLIVGQLPPPVHGSNVMAELLWQSLQSLGYQVEMVQKTFSRDMREVERFSFRKLLRIFTISARLVQALQSFKPGVCIYFNTVKFRALVIDALFLFILRLFRVPYILYSHGKGLRTLGDSANPLKRFVVRGAIAQSAGALVLGERLKADFRPYLEENKMFVLPNALPDQAGSRLPPREGRNPRVQVLFLSNLIETKGPMEFLRMAKEVAARASEVSFVLAGPPVEEVFYRKLLAFIERENLTDRVEVPGGLFGEAKAEVFRKSDIFIFPTKKEALPLVILEAMQWGLPVVSSAEGAIPEVVVDGVTGFIVNPRDIAQLTDRVLRLVNDPELR